MERSHLAQQASHLIIQKSEKAPGTALLRPERRSSESDPDPERLRRWVWLDHDSVFDPRQAFSVIARWMTCTGVVSDLPCVIRREGGQSLVIGGPSLVILEGKACNPL